MMQSSGHYAKHNYVECGINCSDSQCVNASYGECTAQGIDVNGRHIYSRILV